MRMMAKMRSRMTFFLAASIFLIACYLLYSSLDAASTKRREFYEKEQKEVSALEAKLKSLEGDLVQNEALINDIRNKIYHLVGAQPQLPLSALPKPSFPPAKDEKGVDDKAVVPPPHLGHESGPLPKEFCKASQDLSFVQSDVQMLEAYETLGFDNPDGGVWKQGWPIKYDEAKVTQTDPRLEVIVIPHSHCDPGWIKTFERYYSDQVKNILDGMLRNLDSSKEMKFMYAEISFFEMWWRSITEKERKTVKRLLDSGKFEIVTGGWVMTDEANSH